LEEWERPNTIGDAHPVSAEEEALSPQARSDVWDTLSFSDLGEDRGDCELKSLSLPDTAKSLSLPDTWKSEDMRTQLRAGAEAWKAAQPTYNLCLQ
jgi:hypothetical protein